MTFTALSISQLFTIHKSNPLIIACLWMFPWYWQIMLDIKSEFLFEDTKWLSCFFALYNACKECINIFCGNFCTHFFRIIFSRIKRSNILPCSFFFWYIIPLPTIFFDRCAIKRLVIGTNSFVISKRRNARMKKFSPLPR